MVAGAKADLLRREDYSNLIQVRDTAVPKPFQGFPGGWGSPVVSAINDHEEVSALTSLSSLGQALPMRDRTSSLSSAGSSGSRHSGKILSTTSTGTSAARGVYQPPVPTYAISSAEAIPPGYVAHARDACVTVDYQWDSMRDPQNWGNGGEYGEEWSSMHKRFRRGLQSLIQYYQDEEESNLVSSKLSAKADENKANGDNSNQNDEDVDLVVILVTHGAGCNALIGALTNQPVLLDVGMASLTMAVRKPTPKPSPTSTPFTPKSHSRHSSRNLVISDEYEVKLVANTEHLRTSSNSTPTLGPTQRHFSGLNGTGNFIDTERSRSMLPGGNSSNFGSIRRAASIATPTPTSTSASTTPHSLSRTYHTAARTPSIGLWSAPKPATAPDDDEATSPGDDMVLNFGTSDDTSTSPKSVSGQLAKTLSKSQQAEVVDEEQSEEDELPPLGGLWGSPKVAVGDADIVRQVAPKRRWTVNEPGIT